MKILFSIVIPCYNVAPYLRNCLDSVLRQTCEDWECLCIDDGSTDGTGDVLDEYAKKDVRIRVVHQANAGEGGARNTALEIAKGDYICFLDGDDAYNKNAIRILKDSVVQFGDVDVLCLGDLHRSTDFNDGFVESDIKDLKIISGKLPRNSFSYGRFRRGGGCMVYNRVTIGEVRFCKQVIGADTIMAYSIYWKSRTWTFIDATIYFYFQRDTSVIHKTPSFRSVYDCILTEQKLDSMLIENRFRWRVEDMREFLEWNASLCYYTFCHMFFKLPDYEMKKCLSLWLQVQREQWRLGCCPLSFKFKTAIISFVPLPSVVRYVTRYVDGFLRRYRKIKHFFS